MGLGDLLRRWLGRPAPQEPAPPELDTFAFATEDQGSIQRLGEQFASQGLLLRAADCFLEAALIYAADGFFLKATSLFKRTCQFDPDRAAAFEVSGAVLKTLGLEADGNRHTALFARACEERGARRPPTEPAALRSLVARTPADPAPRLVLADWLLEQEDPRGLFIRQQTSALLQAHEAAWLEELRPLLLRWQFRGGFVDAALLTLETWSRFGAEIVGVTPLSRVHLIHLGPQSDGEDLERALGGAHGSLVERLTLLEGTPEDALVPRLRGLASQATGVRELTLRRCLLSLADANSLAMAFPRLRLLDLRDNGIVGTGGLAPFVRL